LFFVVVVHIAAPDRAQICMSLKEEKKKEKEKERMKKKNLQYWHTNEK